LRTQIICLKRTADDDNDDDDDDDDEEDEDGSLPEFLKMCTLVNNNNNNKETEQNEQIIIIPCPFEAILKINILLSLVKLGLNHKPYRRRSRIGLSSHYNQ